MTPLQKILEQETDISSPTLKDAVCQVIDLLDKGHLRVAEKIQDTWVTHAWVKQAILFYFQLSSLSLSKNPMTGWYDKIPLKYQDWDQAAFEAQGARIVPGALIRKGAYVAPKAILMPSYVNIGGYVGEGTLIDTWSTVGSCAQVGKNCHISGGVGLGGVLEPIGANPVIIEDDCFIGARSEIVEGVIVEQGCVIAMGTFIGQSTKIVERETGMVYWGRVPAYSVVVPGSMPSQGGVHLNCAVIVKRVDERTRAKVSLNELLRD